MKRIIALSFALLLLCGAALAEDIIINKIKEPDNPFTFPEDAKLLEVYFPKIAGCDAMLLRYGELTLLVDSATFDQHEAVLQMFKTVGVEELTYAFNTHPDPDHIGGIRPIARAMKVGEFITAFPENVVDTPQKKVLDTLTEYGVPIRTMGEGDHIPFGEVDVRVVQRYDEKNPRINNNSAMLMVTYGERNIFLTGDIQLITQKVLIEEGIDLKADILKFPHHGYANMQAGFLKMIAPQMVVVTSGRGSAEGVQQLKDNKITHYFCENGILSLKTDGTVWLVERIGK